MGQALNLESTGDEGSLTPAALAFRVISCIAPACRKRPYLSSMYALLYAIALDQSSPLLPLPPPPYLRRACLRCLLALLHDSLARPLAWLKWELFSGVKVSTRFQRAEVGGP